MWLLLALTLVTDGRTLFERNQFKEARTTLERAVRENPASAEARYWLGFTCLAMADHEAAILQFERIETRYSGDTEFLFAASEAYTRRARQLSDLLSSRGDASARRHQHFAHRHLARGDETNALVELDLAIQRNPALPGLHEEKAEILWTAQNQEEAAAALRAEIRLNPHAFLSNLRLGQYLLQQKRAADAIVPLTIAVRHRRYPEAYQLLAYAYELQGRPGEAQGVVVEGLALFPDHAGLIEMRKPNPWPVPLTPGPPLQEKPPALARLRTTAAADESLFWMNRIYAERAAELLNRLQQVAPGSARLSQAKGLNAEYEEDYAAAEAFYRQALGESPTTAGLHFSLGHVLRLQGKDDEAAAELERDVQNHLALYERALLKTKHGEFAAAAALLKNAIGLSPQFSEAQTELAKCYLQTAEPAKAIAPLKSVLARQPDHPTAHFLLGRAYRALNQPELARQELEIHGKLMQQQRTRKGISPMGR